MNKKINLIEGAMKYRQIVLAFVFVMMVLGAIGLINMPRREYPEFTIRQGVIVGIYPGATSLEVEEQLTKEVENYIFSYEEVDKEETHSVSKEGMMYIVVELHDNIHNSDKVWSKLRHGLAELKAQLPSGVVALVGNNDFGDTSALLITLSSEKKSYRQLEVILEDLEDDIRKINSVSKIKRFGIQDEEINVYIQEDKLNEYKIDPISILSVFKMHEFQDYSGELDNGELVYPVHVPSHFESEKDLMNQIIYSDPQGNNIRLKDIARIERKYKDPDSFIRNNDNNALLLSLEMQKGKNIVHFGNDVKEVLDQFSERADKDVEINIISDLPDVVDDSISHFLVEFLIAIVAVIIVTMILLPFRMAAVAGVTIPISILITLGIMQMVGIQLHVVSLAGLIVVLGMVVDNAIVVVDKHIEKLEFGETPWNAAWKAATELIVPVFSATLAIIAAFSPTILFLTGMAKDFVESFPVTIGIALIVSMLVAVLLVPLMCYIFIKRGLHEHKKGNSTEKKNFLDRAQAWYDAVLEWTFRNGKVTIGLGILSIVTGVLLFKNLDMKLFPAMERKQFPVEVYLAEGSSLDQTQTVVDSLAHLLLKDDRITNVASFIGTASPRFNDLYAPHQAAKNFGQLMVNTVSDEATIEILDEYSRRYRNHFPGANIKWKQLAAEDFESPIEIRISGDSIPQLKEIAEKVKQILQENEQITWARNDWGEMRQGIRVRLDENKANQLGYAKTLVATSLMASLDGLPLTTIWEGDYPVNVKLIKENEERDEVDDLKNQYISSPLTMEALPLRSIATLEPEWTEGMIAHRNGVRTVTVKAEVERGIVPSNVFKEIQPELEKLELPQGYLIDYGGDYETTEENLIPLIYSLLTSVVLIFFILLVEFKTSRRALLIMSTMLMSIPGVALGLTLTGYPFGLTSFVGIIGLVGIVVRNGIILVDYAMQLVVNEGYTYKEAGIAAGKRRMRPIFLTAMAAAMGVVPMIISRSPLWGPLGTVLCFGLIIGMILTLLILPVLYWKVSGNGPHRKKDIPSIQMNQLKIEK